MCFWAKVVLHFVKLVLSMLQNLLRLWRVVFALSSFHCSVWLFLLLWMTGRRQLAHWPAGRWVPDETGSWLAGWSADWSKTAAPLSPSLTAQLNSAIWFLIENSFLHYHKGGISEMGLKNVSVEMNHYSKPKDCLLTLLWTTTQELHSYTSSWFSVFDGSSRLNQWLGQLGWQKVTLHSN